MFVGSQNMSKAGFGQGGQQPTNVELGVVVKATTAAAVEELRARFPVQFAPDSAFRTCVATYHPPCGPLQLTTFSSTVQFSSSSRSVILFKVHVPFTGYSFHVLTLVSLDALRLASREVVPTAAHAPTARKPITPISASIATFIATSTSTLA